MINKDFKSIPELLESFPTEQSCIDHLEQLRWDGNVISPFDAESKVYKCKGNKYRCKNTGKYFNVKTNTLFDNSKIPLQKWFLAMWLATCHKKGISSPQLAKDMGVTQRTAWFILQRIRRCFGNLSEDKKLDNEVELDEAYIGGKNKNRHKDKKVKKSQGRSSKDKTPVFGMIKRDGDVIAIVVPDTKRKTLTPLINDHIEKGSNVYTDEWGAYRKLNEAYNHGVVYHKIGNYVIGRISTNNIECYWSHLKRMIIGIHHWISKKHLQLYVNAQSFRYNTRKVSEYIRFNMLLCNMENRITYKELIYDSKI